MGLFGGNPMGEQVSAAMIVARMGAFALLFINAWYAGTSINQTFETTLIGGFIIAGFALSVLVYLITIVKNGDTPRFQALSSVLGIIVIWLVILMANTHGAFYRKNIPEIQQNELTAIKTDIELVKDKGINALQSAAANFDSKIEVEIGNLKNEIQNPKNQGFGKVTDSILVRISGFLGRDIQMPQPFPNPRKKEECRLYANAIAETIRNASNSKKGDIRISISKLDTFLKSAEFTEILVELADIIKNFDEKTEAERKKTIKKAYAFYDKTQKFLETLLSNPAFQLETAQIFKKQQLLPPSVDLETSYYFFFSAENIDKGAYWGNLSLALFLDAVFLILAIAALPKKRDW